MSDSWHEPAQAQCSMPMRCGCVTHQWSRRQLPAGSSLKPCASSWPQASRCQPGGLQATAQLAQSSTRQPGRSPGAALGLAVASTTHPALLLPAAEAAASATPPSWGCRRTVTAVQQHHCARVLHAPAGSYCECPAAGQGAQRACLARRLVLHCLLGCRAARRVLRCSSWQLWQDGWNVSSVGAGGAAAAAEPPQPLALP